MSAPVTEAHIDLVRYVLDAEWWGSNVEKKFAQLIADSEARATDELFDELKNLEITAAQTADRNAELRAEVERLRECCDQTSALCGKFITEDDGTDLIPNSARIANALTRLEARAERAEREVADLKANNRFHRGHSAGYAEAKADCEAELAAERARLDWLLSRMGANVLPVNGCVAWTVDVYHYKNQFPSRAAIDAAMKEGSA